MTTGELHVLDGGLLTTIQDAVGRPGRGRYGIPTGGAMDAEAARLANRLVGNRGDEAVLEITLQGPTLSVTSAAHVGLAGADLGAVSEHLRLVPGYSYRIGPGAVVRFEHSLGTARGVRAYLAVAGGFDVAPVLGSVATDRRSGFGGLGGRELRAGDILAFRGDQTGPQRGLVRAHPEPPIDRHAPTEVRVIPTPGDLVWFGPEALHALVDATWTVAPDSDRNGIRLCGGHVSALTGRIPSLGVPVGSVQVPPSGEPIVTMVDGPVTGGYPVVGVVPAIDLGRLAQLAPGATLHFRRIGIDAARELAHALADAATRDRIEVEPGDVGTAWAG